MKKLLFVALILLLNLSLYSQSCDLYSVNMNDYPSSLHSYGFTRSQGTAYTCGSVVGPYVWYTSGTGNMYIASNDIDVPQGKAISVNIKSTKKSGASVTLDMYIRVTGYYTFNYSLTPTDNGWVKINTSNITVDCNSGANVSVPSSIVGGQRVSVCLHVKGAYSTSWWALTGLCVSSASGSAVATTYEEKFSSYPTSWYPSSSNIKIPYHSSINGSNAYTYLYTSGVDGYPDQYAALYTGFDITNTGTGATNIITAEINTSNYANGELRYAFKALYPCGGPASSTYDENYTSYAPKVYIQQGQYDPNNWINLPVNSYFPDNKWHYASYDISGYKNQNIKIKFERGGYCTNPSEGIDNIKVFDRNCKLSNEACGAISGPDSPQPNTNVQYSVDAVSGAVYYKWIVRDGGLLYSKAPYIVSGQGTTTATINIGALSSPRIICIPYDANLSLPATDTTAVCYAKLSYKGVSAPSCTNLAITGQPVSDTKCTGQSVTFAVSTTGSTPSYSWKKGNEQLTNDNGQLTINNIKIEDAGSYSCVVTNSCSSVTTDAATLAINLSPTININPVSQGICNGSQVTLSASATGTAPINYQWRKNGSDISGATNTLYEIASATSNDAGIYLCAISNACGTYSSSAATLTTDASVAIITQPVSLIKCVGQSAIFSLSASGGDLNYQWRKNSISIDGATHTSYQLSAISLSDSAQYSCRITNTCGEMLSNNAKLSVNDTVLKITQNPVTITKCEGEAGSLEVKLSGISMLKYQWLKGNKNIGIATNNTYTIDSLTKTDEDYYFCKINNGCKTVYSDTVFILINTKPSVNSSPINVQKLVGEYVRFSISPIGTQPFSYQWKKDNVLLPNSTSNVYIIPSIVMPDAGYYQCSISNVCGSKVAGIAYLMVKGIVPNTYIVDGTVVYDNAKSTPLNNVKLYLKNKETAVVLDSIVTDSAGNYKFYNVADGTYEIKAKTSKANGGYDPTDALIINKIFLNLYVTTDSLKLSAGDVNADGRLNSTDALVILRRFLKITTSFKGGDWLFSDEPITVSGGNVTYNIIGICVGDVNGSFTPKND